MSSAGTVPPVEQPPLSEVERVVDTFVAPSKTFTDIRRSASWWVPWMLVSIASLALVFTVDKKVGMDKVAENSIQLSPKRAAKLDQLPPDQRASQMELAAKITRMIGYGSPIMTLIIAGVLAVVLLATFNFGLSAELKFKQCMAISMYAFLPGIIKALLVILTIMVGGGEGFSFENQLASNLGPLIDPSSPFLHSVAIVARPLQYLDARTDRYRLRLRDQAKARDLHGRGLRLVGRGGARGSGIRSAVQLRARSDLTISVRDLRQGTALSRADRDLFLLCHPERSEADRAASRLTKSRDLRFVGSCTLLAKNRFLDSD